MQVTIHYEYELLHQIVSCNETSLTLQWLIYTVINQCKSNMTKLQNG